MKKKGKIVAGTGHRPQYLPCSYKDEEDDWAKSIKEDLKDWLIKNKPKYVISGGATGWDLWLAEVSLQVGIPVKLYLPFPNHGKDWIGDSKIRLDKILSNKLTSVVITQNYWSPDCYHNRDRQMVNDSDMLLALWSGIRKGGTFYTIDYANKNKKPYINFWNDPNKNNG